MDSVWRAAAIYIGLMIIMRLAGKRSLAQITTFDFVLLLIIGEATQNALLGQDFSVTNAMLVIITLVTLDIGLSLLKRRSKRIDKWLDDVPLVIVEDGVPLKERMDKARVDVEDVLSAARHLQGIERLDQIRYAVLERSGGISIIPKKTLRSGRWRTSRLKDRACAVAFQRSALLQDCAKGGRAQLVARRSVAWPS